MKFRMIACLAVLFISSFQIQAQDNKGEVRTLAPSQTVEREIKGGEKHAYLISLRRGDFMHVEVDQRGIDVVVSFFAPDGSKLVEMNNRLIGYGAEPLSFAADASGSYRFEVSAATATAVGGRYTVHLNELRSVSASDRIRIAAERSTADGQKLRVQGTGESYRRALDRYQVALKNWREIGDRYWEATTLTNIGVVHANLDEKQKTLEFYNQALALTREVKDVSGEARILNNLGIVYDSLGEKQKALEFYNQALPIRRAVGDKLSEAHTLIGIGIVYNSLDENQKALKFYNQALLIYQAVGDKSGVATTFIGIGIVYSSLGEKQKALEFYNQALPMHRAVGDKLGEANTLVNIGLVYDSLGEKQKALEFYNQALPIYQGVGDKSGVATTLHNLGNVYNSLGEKQKALEFYNQALPVWHAVDGKSGEANTLIGIGVAYDSLGEKQKALEFYNQALPIYRAVGDKDGEALTLGNLMLLSDTQNKPGLAIFYGKQAVNLLQQLRASISGLEKRLQQSFLHSKEDTYRQLVNILIGSGRLLEAEEVLALLKDEEYSSLRRRDDPKSSVGYSPAETEAVTALDRLGELGREANELRGQQDKKVLYERGRQRLEQIERELLPKANAQFREALLVIERAPATAVKTAEIKEAQSLMRYLREMGPGTVALYTVVSTEKGKSSKGWIILVTPNFRRAYEMDITGLDHTVAAFRQTLRSNTHDPQPLAQKLYQMIFLKAQKEGKTLAEDLEAYLRGQKEKTLMWSLDGVLRYVPMAALHDGENYLVENYRNVTFTPASLPGLLLPTSREWNALGLGVSKEFAGFTALAGVPKELAAIVSDERKRTKGVLRGTIKWDDEFKEKAMMDSLSEGYKVVHIASHFSYQAANPEKSFLLLGDGSRLEMSKIQDLTTLFDKTDLVTLSACDTAVGSAMKDANGKDVEGFAYVTQKLGAMAVIASLWPVDDIGTQVLMPKFYSVRKSNPGMVKAEALRLAQLSLLQGNLEPRSSKQNSSRAKMIARPDGIPVAPPFKVDPKRPYAHPYYWAPFVLIGNWK
jgi:CHAT domain-containing protein/predicted negative regulator of RcsB-dependent stress response